MVVVRPTAGGNKYICYISMARPVREGVRLSTWRLQSKLGEASRRPARSRPLVA
ncbi:hypothetical protein BDA96_03G096900 [Sorghum bicolor]|uniref:Uncharacterized protein n=2 Tax=Sorghum bicolor TaxID=4558 RepID=A0A921RCK3_SORBI|nr:hypothetical protein BDA96_03G096900 [Sorghum bicolor]KXG32024.1 hypothetical protein SORBI_3003G092100 [Sorghum bicolor]